MLRFRNRFKGTPSDLHVCKCGQRLTHSIADGRETFIHELPWCAAFKAIVDAHVGQPDVSTHIAVAQVGSASPVETVILADGDSASDVQ